MSLIYTFKIFSHRGCGPPIAPGLDGVRMRSAKSSPLKTPALESVQVVPFPGTPSATRLPGQLQFSPQVSAQIPDSSWADLGSQGPVCLCPSQHLLVSAARAVWRPGRSEPGQHPWNFWALAGVLPREGPVGTCITLQFLCPLSPVA